MSTSNPYEIARVKARDAAVAEATQKAADTIDPEILLRELHTDSEFVESVSKLVRQVVDEIVPGIVYDVMQKHVVTAVNAAVVAAFAERFPPLLPCSPLPPSASTESS